jgi:enoyl-CoA hydratase/carnithine racemase
LETQTTQTERSARIDQDDRGVLTVTLTRPRKRNCLDMESFAVIHEAFAERALDPRVRCVVLRGEGQSFCSGLDRSILATIGGGDRETITQDGLRLQAIFDAVELCPRPTLAVVQGACVGGGVALLLACDLRVASDDAFFTMMEMRYAFVPDLGHVHRLQREVGLARAKQFVLLAEQLPAATLGEWGVLNQVVPPESLQSTAQAWEDRLVAAPPLAVEAAKRIMQADPSGSDGATSQQAALAANADRLLRSADFREGLTAALEGRPPAFTGE